jgi:hypothetical protein
MGKDIAYVREKFEEWAPRIFVATGDGAIRHVFDARVLRGLVQSEVLDRLLSSADVKTGLCIVTKRIDTGSVWPVINNPFDQYFHAAPGIGNAPSRKGKPDHRI